MAKKNIKPGIIFLNFYTTQKINNKKKTKISNYLFLHFSKAKSPAQFHNVNGNKIF